LTPYTGKYTIYVSNKPENLEWDTQTFYYNWCTCNDSHADHATVLNIQPSDNFYLAESTYLVLVQPSEFSADQSATYSITYSTGDSSVRLQEGVQFVDDVKDGSYKFYSFPVYEFHEDISIRVTSFSGDPDLYLSIHPNNTKPDINSHDFASIAFGGEILTLTWEQGFKDICARKPTMDSEPVCMLYMSVLGYHSSSYSIKVISRKDIPELLVENFPLTGQINETQYDYYYTYFGTNATVSIVLEALNGDSDLFVNVLDASSTGEVTEWPRPNLHLFDYSSQSSRGNELVRISAGDLASHCPSKACLVLTGIYCFSSYCRYSVNAHQESVPTLLDGQPRNGYIEGNLYSYYSFVVSQENATILITLTPTSQGNPDLVVAKGASSRPTQQNYTWASSFYGSDQLMITAEDLNIEGSTRGVYIIGVFSLSNTTYTLTATAAAVPVILLIPGQPHSASMEPNAIEYFYFMIEDNSTVSVTLTSTSGSPVLAALKTDIDPYDNLPTLTNYTWSSLQSENRNELEIKPSDPEFCLYCLVVIGVFTQETSCTYSISVAYSSTQLILQNGVPHRDFIQKGTWQYYSFSVPEKSSFAVSLTAFSGNPDLYIGEEDPVDKANAVWHSEHKSRVDYIKVKDDDSNFLLGVYSIGVFGHKNSSYSITAHTKDSYISLVHGWPQTYSVDYRDHDRLLFTYKSSYAESRSTYCRLMPLSPDFFPSLYYTFKPNGHSKPVPSPKHHDVALDSNEYDSIFSEMKFTLPFREAGNYLIGVYGDNAEGHPRHEFGEFELYCSSEDQFNILRVGYNDFEVLTKSNSTKRYEVHINEPGSLEVYVEPCVGKVSLGISSNFMPFNDPDLVVSRITDGTLVATVPHASGQYYITVNELAPSTYFEGASYQLTTKLTQAGQTQQQSMVPGDNGQIQWEVAGKGEIKLSWGAATYENDKPIDLARDPVVYRVYYTHKSEIKMLTACEMHAGELLDLVENALSDGFTKATSVKGDIEVDLKFLGNVVAYLRRGEGGMLEHVVYNPTEVYLPSAHPEGVGLLVFVIITGALIMSLGVVFYVYRKYKHLQSRLEYEMTDVRNLAGHNSEGLDIDSLSLASPRYMPVSESDS
jgi:hypothetical protein